MIKPCLFYYPMSDEVVAFSTTRHGGYSKGRYGEFNINAFCGDEAHAVIKNKALLCNLLGITVDQLVLPHQIHSDGVRQVNTDFWKFTNTKRQLVLDGVDAVMTDISHVCIGVSTADCIPILLYDSVHHACCAVHAGWRGTVKRIAEKAVNSMMLAYHTNPEDLIAYIGPGISLDNFEVGDEVYQAFVDAHFDVQAIATRRDKWHIDLWECNRLQLLESGMNTTNITIAGICTYDHVDDFFSARRLSVNSGRIYTGIMIK